MAENKTFLNHGYSPMFYSSLLLLHCSHVIDADGTVDRVEDCNGAADGDLSTKKLSSSSSLDM